MQTSNKKISNQTLISRQANLIFNRIDNEIVILSLKNEEYYSLNQVGAVIWELIAEPICFERIIENLTELFEVPYDECRSETIEYLYELHSLGIIVLT